VCGERVKGRERERERGRCPREFISLEPFEICSWFFNGRNGENLVKKSANVILEATLKPSPGLDLT